MSRFRQGWELTKKSWALLRSHRELFRFPVYAALAAIVVVAATVGPGFYLIQDGQHVVGGLLGKAVGKTFGKIGGAATGMAFSFATTWALGQVARRYYAGGRQMSGDVLRQSFQGLLGPAKELQQRYLPQIEQTAQGLDAQRVMSLLKGAGPV